MCGIAGLRFTDEQRPAEKAPVLAMRDTMIHRGPDDDGIYMDGNIALVHTRLSIIGVETGAQPMSNSDGSLWLIYNGETYNYRELRRSLESKGRVFRTESDTEVVLQLYAEYGPDCVNHMNGMFSFAIWDQKTKSLFLARDRLGIKPLYYALTNDAFIFGSEIKAILASGEVTSAVNNNTLYEYFVFRAISGEDTLFAGVKSLPPGHRMFVAEDGVRIERYWHSHDGEDPRTGNPRELAEELEALLIDAVKIRLMSEVPLGTFCSGGVDSSLVTALAARTIDRPINTFSVGFHEHDYDETDFARMVSARYETTHHEIKVTKQEFAAFLPKLIRLNDEPLNFANSVHIFAVSQLAKKYVTVVLTGEGADELFLGYPRYQLPAVVKGLQRCGPLVPPLLRMALAISQNHKIQKVENYLSSSDSEMVLMNSATNTLNSLKGVLAAGVPATLDYRNRVVRENTADSDLLSQMSAYDQRTYLVSILNRQDKMSMGASVEARVPFLDFRIVEFANRISSSSKTKRFSTKQIVKKVAEKYLPKEVVHRRKSGFGVPLASWFRDAGALRSVAERTFNDAQYSEHLNKDRVLELFHEHQKGRDDHSELLWTALNFLIWKEQYGL